MKRKAGITAWLIVALSAAITVGVTAHADIYDFDMDNMNDLRKAWMICSIYAFQRGDCDDVWEECHKPSNIEWDGDLKCAKPPKFTNKNDDAQKALQDGAQRVGGDNANEAVADREAYRDDASALDEGTNPDDPCWNAPDFEACNDAMAADAAGESYDTGDITFAEAQRRAIDADQLPVAARLDEGFNPWADEDETDYPEQSPCDPLAPDFEACSRNRALQAAY